MRCGQSLQKRYMPGVGRIKIQPGRPRIREVLGRSVAPVATLGRSVAPVATRRVCGCKFGSNPTRNFCVICILVLLSLVSRQGLSLDFACLFIYSLVISPELFVCPSIYKNTETLSHL